MKKIAHVLMAALLTITMAAGGFPAAALAEETGATTEASAQQKTAREPSADNDAKNATEAEQPTSGNDAAKEPEPETASPKVTDEPMPTLAADAHVYTNSDTATSGSVTLKVEWNDPVIGEPTTFHVSATGGSGAYLFRMDAPSYTSPGEYAYESVADPSRGEWLSYTEACVSHDFTFTTTATGTYNFRFYLMDKAGGVYYLRTSTFIQVTNDAHPSVASIVDNAVSQAKAETNGSEYEMALWLHDWLLDQLEYDNSLKWSSAESALARGLGTCQAYESAYSKLLTAAGITNSETRDTYDGHTWNAAKLDSEWYQIDCTWDDTSDNFYGDLDQRHLYFCITDELMAIAHKGHAEIYTADGYVTRSMSLKDNYFVRNGKADEWAAKYADRIQKHLDAKKTEFSIDADNQSFPPSISGIQNGIVAYAMSQRQWNACGVKVDFTAVSNVTTQSSSKWTAKYDFTAKYISAAPIPDGSYKIMSTIDGSTGILASESGCSMSKAPRALDFKFDTVSGRYLVTSDGKALTLSGTELFIAAPNGSASQQWTLMEVNGGYALINAASGKAIDDRWRDTREGALAWAYTSSLGDPAQTWTLAAPSAQTVTDGSFRILSSINGLMGVSALEEGCEMSSAAGCLDFKFDVGTGLYTLTSAGNALTMKGAELSLKPSDGSASQQWSVVEVDGGYTLVNAASGKAIDDRWRDTREGALVWGYESNLGDRAQTWTLKAPEEQTIEDGEYRVLSGLDSRMAVEISNFGCTLKSSAEAIRFERDDATGYYKLSKGDLSLTADGYTACLAKPNGKGTQLWRVGKTEGGYTITNAANGMALDAKWCMAMEGSEVWLYSSNATKAQTWSLKEPETRAVADGLYNIMSTIDGIAGVSASEFGCTMSQMPCAFKFEYSTETGLYRISATGMALQMSEANIFLAKTNGAPNEQWSVVKVDGGYTLVNAASGKAIDDRWRDTREGALVWGYESNLGDRAQTWALVPIIP